MLAMFNFRPRSIFSPNLLSIKRNLILNSTVQTCWPGCLWTFWKVHQLFRFLFSSREKLFCRKLDKFRLRFKVKCFLLPCSALLFTSFISRWRTKFLKFFIFLWFLIFFWSSPPWQNYYYVNSCPCSSLWGCSFLLK